MGLMRRKEERRKRFSNREETKENKLREKEVDQEKMRINERGRK